MVQKAFNLVVIVLLLTVFGTDAEAQTPTALVEAKLLPDGELAVRQRCELAVRFLSDGFAFSGTPSFPDIQIEGAIVVPPRSGMNLTERRSGQIWIGVERSYSVYPTRTGQLVVPAITIGASVRNSAGVADVTAKSESFMRQVVIPSVLAGNPDAVVTPKLVLSQQFEPDVNELKVGDAIKRTITVTANDTAAMLLPTIVPTEIDGLKAYPDQAILNDKEYRGDLTATRTDSVTYIAQKEGQYVLPQISVYWWDSKQDQVREARVPALALTVVANPSWAADQNEPNAPVYADMEVPTSGRNALYFMKFVTVIICLFLMAGWLLRRHGRTVRDLITDCRARRTESERAYFERFRQACQNNDPHTALRTLLAWLDRQSVFYNVRTLEEFVRQTNDTELGLLINNLYTRLFGKENKVSGHWSGEPLAWAVARARRKSQKQLSKTQKDIGLCPLNPST